MAILLRLISLFLILGSLAITSDSKSTIEPCDGSDSCSALVGYLLPTDLKVSEIATRFKVDSYDILGANGFDPSAPNAQTQILPSGSLIKVPVRCQCLNGIRKSASVSYKVMPFDTPKGIAGHVFGGLVAWDQIAVANNISRTEQVLDIGQELVIPLPCSCYNLTDNGIPSVFLSYAVKSGDSLDSIGKMFQTTVSNIMDVNSLYTSNVHPGDVIAVSLPGCSAGGLQLSSNDDVVVAHGSYVITADNCVQCSCGPTDQKVYCTPSSMTSSCPSFECKGSNLLIGDAKEEQTSAGCNVTSCSYSSFANRTIVTRLTNVLQPRCVGKHALPIYNKPPQLSESNSPKLRERPKSSSSASSASSPSVTIGVVKSNPTSEPNHSFSSYNSMDYVTLLSFSIMIAILL